MKRIIIINEGETEQEFCKDVLQPYFFSKDILIQHPTIKKSGGGIVAWETLKKQIETHLKQDPSVFVTTLIDFYGLHDNHKFPNWEMANRIVDINDKISFLEQSMQDAIDETLRHRYIPYIQLYEFEGLLFNNIEVFNREFTSDEFSNYSELETTFSEYPNPELINDGRETAPSKRLMRIIKGYNKPIYGSLLAQAIGLERIRNKSPRFNNWINTLEAV